MIIKSDESKGSVAVVMMKWSGTSERPSLLVARKSSRGRHGLFGQDLGHSRGRFVGEGETS